MSARAWGVLAIVMTACGGADDPARPGRADQDEDGVPSSADCDDTDPTVHPGALDVCNGVDDDCDGTPDGDPAAWPIGWADEDGDGHGAGPVRAADGCDGAGVADDDADCDDADANVRPGAEELCNGVDDDCDDYTVEAAERAGIGYATIQGAVDAASAGDVVVVCDGTWDEPVRVATDLVLTSKNGASATTLDGLGQHAPIGISDGATVELVGLTIRNGRSLVVEGGAVSAMQGGPLTVTDCVFEDNASPQGGAIAATDLVVTGSTFLENVADPGDGGAISVSGDVMVTGSSFVANVADDGGAISSWVGAIELTDCAVDANVALDSGGGIFPWRGTTTLTRTTFTGNTARFGGAVATDGGTHVADAETVFDGNTASWFGGALHVTSSLPGVTWTGGTFRGNHAMMDGGAIYVVDWTGPTALSDLVVEGNSADRAGGGIAVILAPVTVTAATVTGNTAAHGGGITLTHTLEVELVDVVLTENAATGSGGAIELLEEAAVTLDGCTLLRNTAASAGGVRVGDTCTLRSVASDFGEGADDNVPRDVRAGSEPYDYGSDASFTCVGADSTCL